MTDPTATEYAPPYDSTQDTLEHIRTVQWNLLLFQNDLALRAIVHDKSKLLDPEKPVFDRLTPKLRSLTYGSDEYFDTIREMGEALQHHYQSNSHHSEHYPNGINDMTLLDIIEMFCDWQAATQRHDDGKLEESIKVNQKRYSISDQLTQIFENTRKSLGW